MSDVSRFEPRVAAIRAELVRRGFAAALLYGSASTPQWRRDPVEFVSGFRVGGRHALAMVPVAADPSMIITPTSDYERARGESWIEAVTAVDDILAGGRRLRPRGVLAVCGTDLMPPEFLEGLKRFLAAEWTPFDDLIDLAAASLDAGQSEKS